VASVTWSLLTASSIAWVSTVCAARLSTLLAIGAERAFRLPKRLHHLLGVLGGRRERLDTGIDRREGAGACIQTVEPRGQGIEPPHGFGGFLVDPSQRVVQGGNRGPALHELRECRGERFAFRSGVGYESLQVFGLFLPPAAGGESFDGVQHSSVPGSDENDRVLVVGGDLNCLALYFCSGPVATFARPRFALGAPGKSRFGAQKSRRHAGER
jgi:hypothetical protein